MASKNRLFWLYAFGIIIISIISLVIFWGQIASFAYANGLYVLMIIVLMFVIGLDIALKKASEIEVELVTIEIIIFASIHAIYQTIGISFFGATSTYHIKSLPPVVMPLGKLCLLLLFLIFALRLIRTIQDNLKKRIMNYFEAICDRVNSSVHDNKERTNKIHFLNYLRELSLKTVKIQILDKSPNKEEVRELINNLVLSAGIQSDILSSASLMFSDEQRKKYRLYIIGLTVLSVIFAAFIPV